MTDKTPIVLNDMSRIEQARKERETAAYHRMLADRAEKIASILEADGAPDEDSNRAKVSFSDQSKVMDPEAIPVFLTKQKENA
jgi:hypothetical protein